MKQKWWERFFDSGFANFFLDRDEEILRRTAQFLIGKLFLKKKMVVFDQCCGIGAVAFALARKGMKIIGVDQSRAYIERAKEKAKKENLACEFYQGDAFIYTPKEQCDAAISWYTSFGYSRDDKKNREMLKRAYESLKRGGYFALDYHNMPFVFKNFEAVRRQHRTINGERIDIKRFSSIDIENGMLISEWEYAYPGGNVKKFKGETRTYFANDIKAMLSGAGFKNIKFYGDIDGSKLSIDSPRCIVVAQKPTIKWKIF